MTAIRIHYSKVLLSKNTRHTKQLYETKTKDQRNKNNIKN